MLDRLRISRRRFLAGSAAGAALTIAGCSDSDGEQPAAPTAGATPAAPQSTPETVASPGALAPTPECGDDDEPTVAQTEGPYFTPNSPERASLVEPGIAGTRLVVAGLVLATDCTPVTDALLDFWHCDNDGMYDNEGYRLRGHQFSADDGSYRLETIVPGLYPGRTRHIHVKVQRPSGAVLTTQLYFPDEPGNATDGIFDAALVMDVQSAASGRVAAFDFVLA